MVDLSNLFEIYRFTDNKLFAGLSERVLSEIGSVIDETAYSDGEVIFREGDPGNMLYLVGDGAVRISKRGCGGEQETLAVIEAGDFFGEMALLDQGPRQIRATAIGQAILGCIDLTDYKIVLRMASAGLFPKLVRYAVERMGNESTGPTDGTARP